MFVSTRFSQLALRIGSAAVFVWLGVAAFMQPQYWAEQWIPSAVQSGIGRTGMSATSLAVLFGIVLVIAATSFITGFFVRSFALVGIVCLVSMMIGQHLGERAMPYLGMIGGLLSLVLWPDRTYI